MMLHMMYPIWVLLAILLRPVKINMEEEADPVASGLFSQSNTCLLSPYVQQCCTKWRPCTKGAHCKVV
jgi:hypothetical protein